MHARSGEPRKVALDQGEQRVTRVHVAIQVARQGIEGVETGIRGVVEAVGELVDLVDAEPGFLQTRRERARRTAPRVLPAVEPLLRRRRHDGAVHPQRRRRIVTLRNAVLPLFEPGPMGSLERDGPFASADSDDVHGRPFGAGFRSRKRGWQEAYARRVYRRRNLRVPAAAAGVGPGSCQPLGGPLMSRPWPIETAATQRY